MKVRLPSVRHIVAALVIAVGVGWLVSAPRAQGTPSPQSFTTLEAGFTQELFGVTGDFDPDSSFPILGGVAFAPDGDVWSSECVFLGTRLHRFDRGTAYTANGTALHPETVVDLTAASPGGPAGGCGMVNHPNGFLYSNSSAGIWTLDAETGLPAGPAMGHGENGLGGGNGLGISIDPQGTPANHVVYVGDDCHPTLAPDSTTCTYWDLDPNSGQTTVFARFDRYDPILNRDSFIDGIYFDPSGEFVFGARREIDSSTGEEHHSLLVVRRPLVLQAENAPVDNAQIARRVPMVPEPDGVAFHAATGLVVTLNESPDCMTLPLPVTLTGSLEPPVSEVLVDEYGDPVANVKSCATASSTAIGGTISVFDFDHDYTSAPTQTLFALGGFRGDLLQVGADGCIYATQGALFAAGQTDGTRYNDGTVTSENSIVRICGGFTPPPGVTGTITAQAFADQDGDHTFDAGEELSGVLVTLTTPTGTVEGTTDATGSVTFDQLVQTSYDSYAVTVSIANAEVGGYVPVSSLTSTVVVNPGHPTTAPAFEFAPPLASVADLSGVVYADLNRNSVREGGEPGIGGVAVTLGGVSAATTTSAADGSYNFTALDVGSYTVGAPATAALKALGTASPLSVSLAAGASSPNHDFGYVTGDLSGFAYVDTNRNSVRDSGEAGIAGVVITLASGGTTATAADGRYAFTNLDAATYSVSAPAIAFGYALFTTSPLSVPLAAGQTQQNVDFGYVPGSITGFAYKDFNNNGIRDAGEPGIPGVTIVLGGAASGAVSTGSTGAYLLPTLSAGTYTVSAPSTVGGFARSTPSPLTVTLAAGEARIDVNFGYRETTKPTCPYVIQNGPPTKVIFTIQDTGGGLASVQITQLTNFSVVLAPPNGSPITTVTTVNYNPPTTAPVTLTATRINGGQSASITFKAKDAFGNLLSCDPTVVTVGAVGPLPGGRRGLRKLLREDGRGEVTVIEHVPDAEHYITVQNNTPGLRQIEILVNRRWYRLSNLTNGQMVQLDVAGGMEPGNENRIVILGRGPRNGTAVVTIADVYMP